MLGGVNWLHESGYHAGLFTSFNIAYKITSFFVFCMSKRLKF